MTWMMVQQLGVSLALGLLVGFQREWTHARLAGLRTLTFVTLLGTVAAMLAEDAGVWTVAAGLIAVAAIVVVGLVQRRTDADKEPGLTTAVAALVMYLVGASLVLVSLSMGALVGGAVVVLLHWKQPMHRFVERMGETDIRGIIQLVLIGLVVLPVLPNETYGPYDVLNPFKIWLMVVLICGLSLAGYIAHRFLGAGAGTLVGGLFGGMISSTATTVSYARRTRSSPAGANVATVVILIASCVVFLRVLFEIALVAPSILADVAWPIVAMMTLLIVIALGAYFVVGRTDERVEPGDDPSELKAALVFGAMYALVLFAVAAAREHFGDQGLYTVAALSGLTDMDAITLSTAQLILDGRIDATIGWRMILLGAMSNLVFKAAVVAAIGHPRLLRRIAALFALALVGGAAILIFWP